MSDPLSNSPAHDGWESSREATGAAPAAMPPYAVLAQAHWPGVEFLVCREDIRQRTLWAIDQPRHTVIVHLGGTMRELDTEIDGARATHAPPSPGDIWLVPATRRYASQARGQVITYAELRLSPLAEVETGDKTRMPLEDLMPRLGHRDEFLHYSVARLGRLSQQCDDLSVMMADRLQRVLRQHLYDGYRLPVAARPAPASL